jgi:hypothetical protein
VVELVGVAEVCALLNLTRGSVAARRNKPDFPRPVAELASGPIWTREQIVGYCRDRTARLHERPGVERVAGEDVPWVELDAAAATIGAEVGAVRAVAKQTPSWFHFSVETGEPVGISRQALGLLARELGRPIVEERVA